MASAAGTTPAPQGAAFTTLGQAAIALGGGAGAVYYGGRQLDRTPAMLNDDPAPSEVVAQHIRDLRMLDSNPRMNLASYVTTWMEEPAQKLIMESLSVNHVDMEIYRSSNDIEKRCVSILAHLWNVPNPLDPVGCATVGSTEACLLGGLNMKKHWADARRKAGKSVENPNLIVAYSFQCCWEKFCHFWDVEMRTGNLRPGRHVLEPEDVEALADENTIGVVAILGSTYTGDFDDVVALNTVCAKLNLPIHVDAASGGFVAPFLYPSVVWDFQLPQVKSISTSGHKYGLVYPGIGWLVFRDRAWLHEDLVFHLTYLGSEQTNITLNFSRPASHIIASYYQFLRLGRQGFTMVTHTMQQVAVFLAEGLDATGAFHVLNDPRKTVPMVTFALKPYPATNQPQTAAGAPVEGPVGYPALQGGIPRPYTVFELADKMKERGWSIPAYKMAPDCEEVVVCRCVVREDFSRTMAAHLLDDVKAALAYLDNLYSNLTRAERDVRAERDELLAHRAPSRLRKLTKQQTIC